MGERIKTRVNIVVARGQEIMRGEKKGAVKGSENNEGKKGERATGSVLGVWYDSAGHPRG